MKGGMAAMLAAARALLQSDVQLQGDVWLTAVVGHEEVEANKDGPKALIEDIKTGRIGGDRIIIVEGRDALWVMSMGSMVFTITLTSDKGGMHTQYVPFSENPIRFVGELIQCIYNRQQELDTDAVHPLAGAERIIGVDTNPKKFELAGQFGATEFISPSEVDDAETAIIDATDGGVDYSFECVGNVELMGTALRCTHKGWGESIIIGVAGAGQEIHARPFLLVTGRSWRGTAFGGVKGRTQLPGFVDRYVAGRIKIDEMISATLPLERINEAFDSMHDGTAIRTVIVY